MSTLLSLDEMMNQNMAAVETAPEFVTPTDGVHNFTLKELTTEKKEAKDKQKAITEGKATEWYNIKLLYSLDQTVQSDEMHVKPGSLTSESFAFTDKGLPYFKARMSAILACHGIPEEESEKLSVGEIKDVIAEGQFKFQATTKKSKNPTTGYESVRYTSIQPVAE